MVRDTLPARHAPANVLANPDTAIAKTMLGMMTSMLQNAGMTQGNGQSSGLQNLQIFGPKSSRSQGNRQNLQTSSSSTGLHPQQALQSPALTSAGTCHEAGQQQQLALLPMHNPSSSTNGLANPSQPAQNPGGQSQTFQMELPEPGANQRPRVW